MAVGAQDTHATMVSEEGGSIRLAAFISLEVAAEEDGLAVGVLLRRRLHLSRTLHRRLKACGGVLLDGTSVRSTETARAGSRIALALPPVAPAAPEDVPFAIVFEDRWLLVVDKPAGLVVHPSRGHPSGTLLNGIVHHRLGRGEPPWAHPVQRLDRGTSGLMLVAKDPYTHEKLAAQMASRRLHRTYVALAQGRLTRPSGVVDVPIVEPVEGPGRTVDPACGSGRPARTRFRRIGICQLGGRPVSLALVRLGTGRTHQIRVHLAYLGHPVVQDPLYGNPGSSPAALPGRQWPALHAWKLGFAHPSTGTRLVFRSAVPFLSRLEGELP